MEKSHQSIKHWACMSFQIIISLVFQFQISEFVNFRNMVVSFPCSYMSTYSVHIHRSCY